jgi:hypothetical protein
VTDAVIVATARIGLASIPGKENVAKRYDPKHPQVLRINPKRQVPVLIHGGVEIFDSTQIFEYFERLKPTPPLWPQTPAAQEAIAQAHRYYAEADGLLGGSDYLAWRDRLTARPAVRELVLQFADALTRFKLPLPDFIERAAARPEHV